MKISIIGAGSTYTPELIEGIGEGRLGAPLDELVLMDTDQARLNTVGGLTRRMLERAGWGGRLQLTTRREEALDGAEACIVQYRIGGTAARALDESIPLAHGVIGQETVGPGGWAKALRTIPPTLEIAEELALRSPNAWLIDFANPVSIVTQALLDEGHRAVGLCNVAVNIQQRAAAHFNVPLNDVEVESVGLNHASWFREITVSGAPQMERLVRSSPALLAEWGACSEVDVAREGCIPSYYLRYYQEHATVLEEQRREGTRAPKVARIEAELLQMFDDQSLTQKPALLTERGGANYSTAALDLIAALTGARPARLVVDVQNRGAIPDLADSLVVEVLCDVDKNGARPRAVAPLGPTREPLVRALGEFTQQTASAARARDLLAAIDALADQDATLSICEGNVTVTMDATLTIEERAAVAYYIGTGGPYNFYSTLASLLERTA
jgi:6-phospho-beta-glucosidase